MKKIILIFIIFLLCGCTSKIEYNLEIEDDVKEEIKIIADCKNNTCNDNRLDMQIRKYYLDDGFDIYGPEYQEGVEYYTKNKYIENNKTVVTYQTRYNYKDYDNSNFAKTYFVNFNSRINQGILTINSNQNFYFENDVENVKISITTSHLIENHNADEVKDNTYTWIITKEDAKTKRIKISVNTQKYASEKSKFNYPLLLFILFTIIIITVGILLNNYKKNKKNNDI